MAAADTERGRRATVLLAVGALLAAVSACATGGGAEVASERSGPSSTAAAAPSSPAPPAVDLPEGRRATVVRVVDGDTLELGGGERVRLIGIDTPETKDPRAPVQCFGQEAATATAQLLPAGTEVVLVADAEAEDRYGRTLAYVHRAADGLFVNHHLVAEGYAAVATYPPNVAHADDLVAAQAAARQAGRGLWSACGGPDGAAGAPGTPTTRAGSAPGCHPSYPTLCLPAAPDLDCADLDATRFPVVPPDPHRLDGDGDGIGCQG